jgi:hypothetical protein
MGLSSGIHQVQMNNIGAAFSGSEQSTLGGIRINTDVRVLIANGQVTVLSGTWSQVAGGDPYEFSPLWSSHRSFLGNLGTVFGGVFASVLPPFSPQQFNTHVIGSAPIDVSVRCFPASTPIQTSLTTTTPISDLRVGDVVLAFDPCTDNGRGDLVPRRVTKLFRNVTTDWVRLEWRDPVTGELQELVATPGHHFLDQFGNFPPIEQMIRTDEPRNRAEVSDQAKSIETSGRASVVLACGNFGASAFNWFS